jgi:hypothetical protein
MRTELALQMREKQLQATIEQLAKYLGWRVYHTYDSRRSNPGFPDLCMVHAGQERVVWAELKSTTGRLTKAQREWLDDLEAAGQECYLWRPSSWVSGEIHRILQKPD